MDNKNSILNLILVITKELEYDKDVQAIVILLSKVLDLDEKNSFNYWTLVLNKINIREVGMDIDLTPLIHDYPIELLDKVGLEKFFNYMNTLPLEKRNIIYRSIFNIFVKDDYFYNYLEEMIIDHDLEREKSIIKLIIDNSKYFSKEVFSIEEFIRQIFLLHLKYEFIVSNLFKYLLTFIDNKKEQAVLKTIVIDYLD